MLSDSVSSVQPTSLVTSYYSLEYNDKKDKLDSIIPAVMTQWIEGKCPHNFPHPQPDLVFDVSCLNLKALNSQKDFFDCFVLPC